MTYLFSILVIALAITGNLYFLTQFELGIIWYNVATVVFCSMCMGFIIGLWWMERETRI